MEGPVALAELGAPELGAVVAERLALAAPPSLGAAPVGGAGYEEDLAAQREGIVAAGRHVAAALAKRRTPAIASRDCSLCMATLPAAVAARPAARVLWLDAHGDFNSPETTPSDFLGGMCLAGACGVWDPGLGAGTLDPDRLVLAGVRDLDEGERSLVERHGVTVLPPGADLPDRVAAALGGAPVFVHLDADVLDPSHMPARYPAAGGLDPDELREVLAAAGEIVGLELTAVDSLAHAGRVLDALPPFGSHG